jgi:threonine dehydrogenase-like Zn-dependent dehydrogenase
VHRYLPKLLAHIEKGDIDPSFVVTHRLPLHEAPRGYEMFLKKQDNCEKVVLKAS